MKLLGFLLLLITVNSCDNTKNTSNELVGTWRHVESLSDIGDGNATFHRVNSKKTMTFNADGTVTSNENVCTGNNFQEGSTADWDARDSSGANADAHLWDGGENAVVMLMIALSRKRNKKQDNRTL